MRRVPPLPLLLAALAYGPAVAAQGTSAPAVSPAVLDAADAWMDARHAAPGMTFARRAVLPVASGVVVRYVERVAGVLVRDAGGAVLLDAVGNVRAENDFTASIAFPNVSPRLTVAEAARVARARIGGVDPGDDGARTVLVWTRESGRARLVYECDLASRADTVPDAPRVLVDARTGAVLSRSNRACLATGAVFPRDPQTTPAMVERTLDGLPDSSDRLRGVEVESFNCLDRHEHVDTPEDGVVHVCTAEHTVAPDATARFVAPYVSPTDETDGYSELAAYAYATQQLAFYHSLGFASLRDRPLHTVSNVRLALTGVDTTLSEDPLGTWDNAAFVPGDVPGTLSAAYGHGRDVLLIGQGHSVDLAHDSDVVSHETGHLVVSRTADFGDWRADAFGLDRSPRMLNEALADYFVAARNADPHIARYAAGDGFEGGALRSLDSPRAYGTAMQGEEHVDSVMFSSALWAAREVAGDGFDRAVFEALALAPNDPSPDGLASLVTAATARTLGGDTAFRVGAVFAGRNLATAVPRVAEVPMARNTDQVLVPGTDQGMGDLVPGAVQLRWNGARGAKRFRVTFDVDGTRTTALRLYARAGEPVRFTYDDGAMATADRDAVVSIRDGHATALFDLPATVPGDTVYFATATLDGPSVWLTRFAIESLEPAASESTNDVAVVAKREGEAVPTATRGCSAGPHSDTRTTHGALALLGAAVLVVAGRSRRRTARG